MNDVSVLESGQIVAVTLYPGGYVGLRLAPPPSAIRLRPGHYLEVDGRLWPVLRVTPHGLELLQHTVQPPVTGAVVGIQRPRGTAFDLEQPTPRALLLGDADGLAPVVFLADVLRNHRPRVKLLVLLSSTRPWPFQPQPSRIVIPGLPGRAIAAMPLLDDWGVPSRLASPLDLPGCFDGGLDELAQGWLNVSQGVADVTVYACGADPVLAAARRLAADYRLPCQTRVPADTGP